MFIKLYLIALAVFLLIDFLWLGLIAKSFYQKQIGELMKENINWMAAFIFYLVFIIGLVIFAINPALENNSWWQALWMGALLGFTAYAAYDLTNLATLKDWPVIVTVIDLIWGATISGATAAITYFISSHFL